MKETISNILRLTIILSLFSGFLKGQGPLRNEEEFVIDFIDVRKGLLSNFVTKTISDEDNIKYFATEDGVSKFDGYTFTYYRPNDDFKELENENIETLFKDKSNNIWIGTKAGGLSMLDLKSNKIVSFNYLFAKYTSKKLRVIAINQSKEGLIWVGTWNNGIFIIDPVNKKLVAHYPFVSEINNIIRDKNDDMWFISGITLHQYNHKTTRLTSFKLSKPVTNLIEDKVRNKIWLVGNSNKKVNLFSYDFNRKTFSEEKINLSARYIKSIALDSKNRLWLGSWGDGLYISNTQITEFSRANTNPEGRLFNSVNNSMILDIDIDKNGIAWLSTAHGGVLILYPNKGFSLLSNTSEVNSIDQNITSIFKDNTYFYKGKLREGLFVGNENGSFTKINTIPNERINCIYEKNNTLFIGTNGGLFIIKNRQFSQTQNFLKSDKITAILLDSQNNLWIGTQQKGLKMTNLDSDPDMKQIKVYSEEEKNRVLDNNRISQIKEDNRGNIWLATYAGLNLYDKRRDAFINHSTLLNAKLPSLIINDMLIREKEIFLATPSGFIILQTDASQVSIKEHYNSNNGLINDFLCSIEEDNNGNIWLSSNTSIEKYIPRTKKLINFGREDGVMINSFHIGSSFHDTDGVLYFGGSNGIITFNPSQIDEKFNLPKIVFTQLVVNNNVLEAGEVLNGNEILKQSIQFTQKIDLSYAQNHLSLSFIADDFLDPTNITYQYKLIGLNNEWVNLGTRHQINFTELGWGKYELLIRASRNNRNWSNIKHLEINIATPPWLTWYAYLFYVLLFIGILLMVRHYSAKQAKLKAELRIAQIEKEKEHELNKAKITFFTNISHEFRTPLTLILSPITEMLNSREVAENLKGKLTLVESNAQKMLGLVSELLDFKKAEQGLLKLNLTKNDIVSFIKDIYLNFIDIANSRKINFSFETNVDSFLLDFDRQQMEIVLNNLLSNAFKFTKNQGNISVEIFKKDDSIDIIVSDDGIGIANEHQEKIFNRFFQVKNEEMSHLVGSGIGLSFSKNIIDLHQGNIFVKSALNKGSVFTIELPILALSKHESSSAIQANITEKIIKERLDIPPTSTTKSNKPLVLIADDSDDIRKYLKSLLENDYQIIEATDGLEALTVINKKLPDIVISDVMMPNMDGIQLCEEIKNQINTSHIPIILLTARTTLTYEISGLQKGADDYLIKPFNPMIVQTKIANLLDNRRKLRDYFLNKVRFEPLAVESQESNLDALFIDKAMQLVNEHLRDENFGAEEMADKMFMSQSTLLRKIKALTGLSINGFIRSIKLKNAAQMILETDLKMSSIAYEVGFSDYKYFTKMFQNQFGCLPSAYKEKTLL